MSLFFGSTGVDGLAGTITTPIPYSAGLTGACWIKFTTHPAAVHTFMELGASASGEDSVEFRLGSLLNDIMVRADGAVGLSAINITEERNDTWAPVVFTDNGLDRMLYIGESVPHPGTNDVTFGDDNIDKITVGMNLNQLSGSAYLGWIAEVAVWNTILSAGDITLLLAGRSPSLVSPSTLRLFYPMDSDPGAGPVANMGLDAGGDLTIVGTDVDFDPAEHPPINFGTSVAPIARFHSMMRTGTT